MRMRFLGFLTVLLSSMLGYGETYLSASGALALPQGNGDLRRVGGVESRIGTYFSDLSALEAEVGWQENYAALGIGVLTHWSAWDLYDRFFGFSAFDPFVTAGVRGWVGSSQGEVGPSLGVGAFYHLTENWSIRAEVDGVLGLGSRIEFDHTFAIGLQYTF